MKRTISLILIFSIFFSSAIVLPNKVHAEETLDYKALTKRLRMNHKKDFKTPTPKFDVCVNGQHKIIAKPDGGKYENMGEIPAANFTCKVGDSIKVSDVSETGSGTSIVKRDWQIGMAHDGKGYTGGYHSYTSKEVTFKADKPGIYVVFLNVADNYSGIPNFQNWSENGNWRTEVIPPFSYPGVTIKGWYFTCFKFIVEDTEKPKAEFEIWYNNKNETDNKDNPVEVGSYPVTVQLNDKSGIEKGKITKWEWRVWKGDKGWQLFSTEQNPTYDVTSKSVAFQLKVISDSGKESNYVEHGFHSKLDSSALDSDFDIFYNGQNKTDGKIKVKDYPFTLSLKDKSTSTGKIISWEWLVYDWNKKAYSRFSSEQHPSMKLDENSPYISNIGEIQYTLNVKDDKGKGGQAQHGITVETETSVDVKARIDAPDYNSQDTGEVDGMFKFTATSDLYDLKKYEIIAGEQYIKDSSKLTGTLTGKKDTKELPISIPMKKQISITVKVTDIKGNTAIGTATHIIQQNRPPSTFISGPNPLYPRFATQTGEYKNLITWSYFDSDNDEMIGTDYELYKITGDLSKEGESALKLLKSDSFYTEGMSEEEKRKIREITIDGEPGEQFRLVVRVHDGKLSNEHDYDGECKPGYWDYQNERWTFKRERTVYRDFVVDTPMPDFDLIIPDYEYIRENVDVKFNDKMDRYPNKFFKDKLQFKEWSIVESETGRVVKNGTGKIPTDIYTEWEVTPKGEKLKGGFYEEKNYVFKQTVSFGELQKYEYEKLVPYDTTTSKSEYLYIVPVPDPEIWITEMYTLINQNVNTESYIKQPPVENYYSYGLPNYTATFNDTNAKYKIYNLSDNKVIHEGKGLFTDYKVSRDNGFKDSIKENIPYKVEQYAENDKGHFSTFTTDLTILQTPEPTVLVGTQDTYIDETIDVEPHGVEEINNIKKHPKNYRDFQDIYDNFKTNYNDTNSKWQIEEVDFYGNKIGITEEGRGIKKDINVFRPKYDETKFYLLTQEVTNALDVTRSNSSFFAVLTSPPPTVTVEIQERRPDLPLIAKDEIYPSESLDIKTTVEDKIFEITETWWEIRNIKTDEIVRNGNGRVDGLVRMDLPIGDYKVIQYAKNEKDKVGSGYTTFKVKPVLPPVIDVVDTNLIVHEENSLYMGEQLKIKLNVKEINQSEEHPEGYEIYKTYAIRDKYSNTVIKEDGTANIEMTVDRDNNFKQGMSYVFNQFAQNVDFPKANDTLSMNFKVGNKKPIVELNTIEGDGQPPLFTGEEIYVDVNAYDLDGTIEKVEYYINNLKVKETPSFKLKGFNEYGYSTANYTANLNYVGSKREDINIKVVAYDDYGERGVAETNFYITKPEIETIIKIVDEDYIQKKENRYIEFTLEDSHTNADIYPLDFENAEIYYQKNNGNWICISDNQNYSDENIRIHYPNYPDKTVISSYFKKHDTYKLKARVPNVRGEKGEWGYKELNVVEDLPPIADFSIVSPYQRISERYIELFSSQSSVVNEDNIDKSFFIFKDKATSPDNDVIDFKIIEVIYDPLLNGIENGVLTRTQILEDKDGIENNVEIVSSISNDFIRVQDINNYKLTFLTDENELGDYYFTFTVKEKITQLPKDRSNPLYDEILNLYKETKSKPLKILIDNIAPILKIEVTGSQSINLIIHFDRTPTQKEEEKIREIIRELENKGIKVNVIREYNRY